MSIYILCGLIVIVIRFTVTTIYRMIKYGYQEIRAMNEEIRKLNKMIEKIDRDLK